MNNRLSFAQILQKKQNGESSKNSRIYSQHRVAQSQFSSQVQLPSLSQLMDSYLQYPDDPDENFIISLDHSQCSGRNSQDFEMGLNPLDSFIMTQSYLNAQKIKSKNQGPPTRERNGEGRLNNELRFGEQSKKYSNIKQNKNVNLGQGENMYKFSTKNYKESLENSQHQFLEDSNKFGPVHPSAYNKPVSNRQMIGNTKIIQSQAYQNVAIGESRSDYSNIATNVPKIERSERVDAREDGTKKLSRYQINYQETQRKEEPDPPKEKKKLILSKVNTHKNQIQQKTQPDAAKLRVSKKPSEEEEYLLAGIPSVPTPPPAQVLSEHQKRIEDAKKQITQYLQVREKHSSPMPNDLKSTKPSFSKPTCPNQDVISHRNGAASQRQTPKVVNYSFAHNQQADVGQGPLNSFEHTKKSLKQIEQQMLKHENQRMLSCIEYTQSQADLDDEDNGVIEYKRNIQSSQSIPAKKQQQHNEEREPFTLEKYIPKKKEAIADQSMEDVDEPVSQQNHEFSKKPAGFGEEAVEESEMVQKICVQPSIEQSTEKYEVNNSDHPKMSKKLSSPRQQENEGNNRVQPYHDVSSIDIKVSNQGSELSSKGQVPCREEVMDILIADAGYQFSNNQPMVIPKLNVSDFESVSNNSLPSPIKSSPQKSPLHENISQVESNPPLSSENQSLNLPQHESNYGFIYKMRVHSRNNSFTSNYNSSIHGSQGENRNLCGSSHSSLCLQGDNNRAYQADESIQGYNMSKYKIDHKKYEEVDVSVSVEIPEPPSHKLQLSQIEEGKSPTKQIEPKYQLPQQIQQGTAGIRVAEQLADQSAQGYVQETQHQEGSGQCLQNIVKATETINQKQAQIIVDCPVDDMTTVSKSPELHNIQSAANHINDPEPPADLQNELIQGSRNADLPKLDEDEIIANQNEQLVQEQNKIQNEQSVKIQQASVTVQEGKQTIESKQQDANSRSRSQVVDEVPPEPALEEKARISEQYKSSTPPNSVKNSVEEESKPESQGMAKVGLSSVSNGQESQEKPFSFNLDFLDF